MYQIRVYSSIHFFKLYMYIVYNIYNTREIKASLQHKSTVKQKN